MARASSAQPGSRSRRTADRRREILEAAREVFAQQGYERAAMAEIAAKVGVVEGALYKHFGSKRELLFETTRALYEPLIAETERELQAVRGTRNRLHFLISRQLRAFADHPELCRLFIQEIRPYDDYHGSIVRELNRKTTSAVVRILEQARRDGELRTDVPPTLVRDVIFGGIEHLAWRALAGRGTLDVEARAEELTQLILAGVQAQPPQAGSATDAELARLREQVDRLEALVKALAARTQSKRR